MLEIVQTGIAAANVLPLLLGGLISAAVSYAAIAWLLQYLQTQSTWIFIGYRLVFAAVLAYYSLK